MNFKDELIANGFIFASDCPIDEGQDDDGGFLMAFFGPKEGSPAYHHVCKSSDGTWMVTTLDNHSRIIQGTGATLPEALRNLRPNQEPPVEKFLKWLGL